MGDWSQLPPDVSDQIMDRLSLEDSLRLGCVWRSGATPSRHRGRLPWVLLPTSPVPPPPPIPTPESYSNAYPKPSIGFLSLLDERVYKMDVGQLAERRICGSSDGWLITIHRNGDVSLINPFSGKTVPVPSLMNAPGVFGLTYAHGRFFYKVSETPHSPSRHRDRHIPNDSVMVRDTFVKKAIVCSGRVVVAIFGKFRKLMIHSPQVSIGSINGKWADISDGRHYFDVACYEGNRYYAVDSAGGVVSVEGLHSEEPFTNPIITGTLQRTPYYSLYLLQCGGHLVQVIQFQQQSSAATAHVGFKVLKVDFQQEKLVEVHDLGDSAIFLSSTHSSSVSTSDFPGCTPNCIYFTHDGTTDGCLTSGVYRYKMLNATVDTIYSTHDQSLLLPTPTWYASMQGQCYN